MKRDRRGGALALAVLLSLAGLLLAHAVLLLSRHERVAAGASVRAVTLRSAAQQGALRAMATFLSDDIAHSDLPAERDSLVWRSGGTSYHGAVRRLAPHLWLAEGTAERGGAWFGRAIAVWRFDPAAVHLRGVVTVAPAAVGTSGGGTVDGSTYLERPVPEPPEGCPPDTAIGASTPRPAISTWWVDSLTAGTALLGPRSPDELLGLRVFGSGLPSPRTGPTGCAEDPWNWGDPGRDGRACEGRFPLVVAAPGTVARGGSGQALVVSAGDVTLDGVVLFGGVLADGRVRLTGGARVTGFVSARGGVDLSFDAAVTGSRCWARQALHAPRLRSPIPLPDGGWMALHAGAGAGPGGV